MFFYVSELSIIFMIITIIIYSWPCTRYMSNRIWRVLSDFRLNHSLINQGNHTAYHNVYIGCHSCTWTWGSQSISFFTSEWSTVMAMAMTFDQEAVPIFKDIT